MLSCFSWRCLGDHVMLRFQPRSLQVQSLYSALLAFCPAWLGFCLKEENRSVEENLRPSPELVCMQIAPRYLTLRNLDHHFCLFQVSDTGQYVCRAINVAGQDDKNFHLNVYGESVRLSQLWARMRGKNESASGPESGRSVNSLHSAAEY